MRPHLASCRFMLVRRSLVYLRPYLGLGLGAFAAMLLVTGANLLVPQFVRSLIDDGITPGSSRGILVAAAGLVGIAIARGLFSFTNAYLSERVSQSIAYDLRNDLFRKLETLSFTFHDTHKTGQLMTRATSDVEGVRSFYAQGLLQLTSAVITFIGSAVILFLTDWQLALASMSTIVGIVVIFFSLFRLLGPRFARVQQNLGQLNVILQENIAGVRVVKAFTGEARELRHYTDQNERLYNENLGVIQLFSLGFPTVFFLANLGTLIVIWYGGIRVIDDALSLGTLVAFNSYLAFLLMPIFQLGFISQQLSRAAASTERLFDILDAENEIQDAPDAIVLPDSVAGHIRFDHVHFGYAGTTSEAIHGIDLDIAAGETVAIVGPTGGGKSSIINLINRFYDPTSGTVLLDGHDLRAVQLDSLRRRIGLVLQEVNLMSGTIRDNIAYGKPDATDREVQRAARAAQAHKFIMEQPNGYETVLGERGAGLSGGQRQRIAIARAVLVNPCVLIFDDSTSALDAATEQAILRALRPLIDNLTTIIIAQRISTVRRADRILVVDAGHVVADGTHDELIASSPVYADIVHSQLEAALEVLP